MNQEVEIPVGCEARIEGNKVVFVPKESEDERIRKHIIEILERLSPCHWNGNEKSECIAYLEEQKPLSTEETELNSIAFLEQLGYTCVPPGAKRRPAEWSDKDESYLQTVINEMEANKKEAREYEHKKYDTIILWLKYLRPQPHWKPSEEQMDALETAVSTLQSTALESLYSDLKNL